VETTGRYPCGERDVEGEKINTQRGMRTSSPGSPFSMIRGGKGVAQKAELSGTGHPITNPVSAEERVHHDRTEGKEDFWNVPRRKKPRDRC